MKNQSAKRKRCLEKGEIQGKAGITMLCDPFTSCSTSGLLRPSTSGAKLPSEHEATPKESMEIVQVCPRGVGRLLKTGATT